MFSSIFLEDLLSNNTKDNNKEIELKLVWDWIRLTVKNQRRIDEENKIYKNEINNNVNVKEKLKEQYIKNKNVVDNLLDLIKQSKDL